MRRAANPLLVLALFCLLPFGANSFAQTQTTGRIAGTVKDQTGAIIVRADSPIQDPKELKGKRVGIGQFWMTAFVWHRAILNSQYGVKQDQVSAAERAFAIAQRAAETAVAPQPPEQPKIVELQDYRALYSTGAVLIVGLAFGTLIFFTLHSEPRHRQAESTPIYV